MWYDMAPCARTVPSSQLSKATVSLVPSSIKVDTKSEGHLEGNFEFSSIIVFGQHKKTEYFFGKAACGWGCEGHTKRGCSVSL